MKVVYKVWLDNNGKAFGEGPYRLLKGVEKTGSLRQAAIDMGMSYRKAWLTLHAAEKTLGFPLLERTVGGPSGGGSQITPAGCDIIHHYEGFRKEVRNSLERLCDKYFG